MKKLVTLLLVCLLVALPALMLVGCNNDVPDPSVPDDPNTPDNPDDPDNPDNPSSDQLSIVENGVAEYRIVISDFAKDSVKKQASALRKAIEAVTGVKPALVTDWDDQNDNADIKEILIGKTNRTESSTLINSLKSKEYGIVVSGNKLVIAAGSDDLLAKAVSYFLATYAGYNSESDYTPSNNLFIPGSLNLIESFDASQNVALYVTNEKLTYVNALYNALKAEIEVMDLKGLSDDVFSVFDSTQYGVVIIAGAEVITSEAKAAIQDYMNNGGRIMTLGGPAFETTLYELDGTWYPRDQYVYTLIDRLDDDNKQLLIDTSETTIVSSFVRNTDTPSTKYTLKVGNYGLEGSSRQLFHEVENLGGWDNIIYYFKSGISVDNSGLTAICFWAKAMDDHTPGIYIEITDANGDRWMTSVSLTTEWEYYVVASGDFKLWKGTTNDDYPSFNNMQRMDIGFAKSGQSITGGHHSYCIADITLANAPDTVTETHLEIDSLAPIYELYPITNGDKLVTDTNQVFVTDRNYVLSDEIVSCSPGRQGIGYSNDRTSRFVPLIEVKDEKGLHSGYAAWMHLFSSTSTLNGKMEGSILACFSSVSEEFYNADGIAAIVETAKVMTRNTFLVEGGTDEFTYVESDTDHVLAGLSYVELNGDATDGVVTTISLYDGNKLLCQYSSNEFSPKVARNNISQVYGSYDLSKGKPDRAVATLTLNGEVIDKIEQDVEFWSPKKNPSYIYIEDGYFKRDGKIVNFFGVNYMPSYGIAEQNGTYFENYVSRAAYDPVVVANDLDRIVELGMNSVSVFVHYNYAIDNNNMLNLIQMCEERGIYVNLSIRDVCYPLIDYNEEATEQLIQYQHFFENDNVYAYDICWEPRIGAYDDSRYLGRKDYDAAWAEWIDVQYGSLAAAEEAWGLKLTKTSEGYPYVSDVMLDDTSGKYLKVTNAYYRFLEDHIAKVMNEGILHMQSVAPNQLITFRMSMSGSGYRHGSYMPSTHCFDFSYLASTLAYMEPEGYALDATEDAALQIPIANAYARYVQPDSPVVWKEFGRSTWNGDDGNFNQSQNGMQSVVDYYAYTLEYCLNSYTSGMYAWYYAGGYRINENSDYGIINPDGSDRPVTKLLREYAPLFINQGERPEADVLIEVERDNQVGGMFGIYEATKDEVKAAYNEGKFIEFVDANQDNAYEYPYADEVYEAAVADAKTENGIYPLRYVNGMIKDFNVVTEGGKTYAEVLVCNTKQSVWRAGTVSIVSYDGSDVTVDYTIDKEVDYLENLTVKFEISGKGKVALRFEIEGVQFGNLYTTTID